MKNPLLRFLDKDKGPIIRLTTNPIGNSNEFLYSFATLSEKVTKGFRSSDILKFGGSGWSSDRLISQEKAITEAIERWAFKEYLDNNPEDSGIEIDNTSNGFSALPIHFKIEDAYLHSYCECVERYLLCQFADDKVFKLNSLDSSCSELKLFDLEKGTLTSYVSSIELESKETVGFYRQKEIYFVLSLFWLENAGVVVGSACNKDLEQAHKKSLQECYMHLMAALRLKNQILSYQVSITDKRLKNFAESPERSLAIKDRVNSFCNSTKVAKIPKITFIKELPGDWNPEVHVVRILLEGARPLTEGDEWRFLI